MMLGAIFVVLPPAVYLGLAALPEGRPAAAGLALIGFLLALSWLARVFGIGPFFTGDGHADSFVAVAAAMYSVAWALAGLVQGARRWLLPARRGRAVYPLLATAVLLLAGVPGLTLLGV